MEKQIVTSNGINIFYYNMPNTHSICISLYVKTGTLYEEKNFGITHFLEHLHFRRLGGYSQKELYYKLESMGASFDADTYKEFLRFYFTSSPKYFSELAKFSSDLLGRLEANRDDVNSEKRLVTSEIREENLHNDINFVSNKYIWEGTNLQNDILGTISSVKGLSLQTLCEEKERVFTKQNIFFYVTGCFSDDDISVLIKEIEKHDLAGMHGVNNNIAQIPVNFMQRNAFTRVFERGYDMHDVNISFDFDMNRISRRELLYLDSILSRGLCSLLRAEIIEKKGLIYSFSTIIEHYNNIGVYHFTYTVHKSKFYECVKSFISVIKRVKNGISEEEMATTIVFETDNKMRMLDNPDGLNWTFAFENHILENSFRDVMDLAEASRIITKEQLVMKANEIFKKENVMLISIGDKKGLSEAQIKKLLLDI